MTRHKLTRADTMKAVQRNSEIRQAKQMRREAELALLDRLLAEAAMAEWYPHQ